MMSHSREVPSAAQTTPTRYRGEYADALIVQTPDHLEAAAPVLQDGLEALKTSDAARDNPPVYAGYALIYYPEPTQEFGFNDPEAVTALLAGMQAVGIEMRDPNVQIDDYFVHSWECLDRYEVSDGYFPTQGLTESSFLLVPVIRGMGDDFSPKDEYEQYKHIHIDHSAAVRLGGITLYEGIFRHKPDVDPHRIPLKEVARYIYDMTYYISD